MSLSNNNSVITFQQFCKDPNNTELVANAIAQGVDIGTWQSGATAVSQGAIDVYQVASGDAKAAVQAAILNCPSAYQFGQLMQGLFSMAENMVWDGNWYNSIIFQTKGIELIKYIVIQTIEFAYTPSKSVQLVADSTGAEATVADASVMARSSTDGAAEIIAMNGEDNIMASLQKISDAVNMASEASGGAGAFTKVLGGDLQTLSMSKLNEEKLASIMSDAMAEIESGQNAADVINALVDDSGDADLQAGLSALKKSIFDGTAVNTGEVTGQSFGEVLESLDEMANVGDNITEWGVANNRGLSDDLIKSLSGEGEISIADLPEAADSVIAADSTIINAAEDSTSIAAEIGAETAVVGASILSKEAALSMAKTLLNAGETLMGGGKLGGYFIYAQLIGLAVAELGLCNQTSGLSAVMFNNYVSIFNEVFKSNALSTYSITTNAQGVQSVNPMYPIEVPATQYCFAVTPNQSTWGNYYNILKSYYVNALSFDLSGLPICNINETYGSGSIMPTSGYSPPPSNETKRQKTAMSIANSNTYYANFVLKWWPFLLALFLLIISIIIFFIIKND